MKNAFMTIMFLSAALVSSANAARVGDQVVFEGTEVFIDGSIHPASETQTLLSLNESMSEGEMEVKAVSKGKTYITLKRVQMGIINLLSNSMATPENIQDFCSQMGGEFKPLTVKGGTFDSCTLPGETTFAHVPFSILKMVQKYEESTATLEVASFSYAQ